VTSHCQRAITLLVCHARVFHTHSASIERQSTLWSWPLRSTKQWPRTTRGWTGWMFSAVPAVQKFAAPGLGLSFVYWTPSRNSWEAMKLVKSLPYRALLRRRSPKTKHSSRFTRRVAKEDVMPVTVNARFGNLAVASLPRPTPEKRRSFRLDRRPDTECHALKPAPPVSPDARDNLNEAEAIQRAQAGEPAVYEYLYRLHSRRVYALCLRMVRDTARSRRSDSRSVLALVPQNSYVSRRIGLFDLAAQAGGQPCVDASA